MSTTPQVAPTVVEQYERMSPNEFREFISKKWNALEAIHNEVIARVEDGGILPYEGAKAIACVTSEVLGYKELHGTLLNSSPMELLTAFRSAVSPGGFRGDT